MFTVPDWIAIATIAAPLVAKAFSDWQANAVANHNAALARIVGMAGREAATILHTVAKTPPGSDAAALRSSLIEASAASILQEMQASAAKVGADPGKVAAIVRGEVDKLEISK